MICQSKLWSTNHKLNNNTVQENLSCKWRLIIIYICDDLFQRSQFLQYCIHFNHCQILSVYLQYVSGLPHNTDTSFCWLVQSKVHLFSSSTSKSGWYIKGCYALIWKYHDQVGENTSIHTISRTNTAIY